MYCPAVLGRIQPPPFLGLVCLCTPLSLVLYACVLPYSFGKDSTPNPLSLVLYACVLPYSFGKDSTPNPLPLILYACVLRCSFGKDLTPSPLLLVLYSCVLPCSVGKDSNPNPLPLVLGTCVLPSVSGRMLPQPSSYYSKLCHSLELCPLLTKGCVKECIMSPVSLEKILLCPV